MAIKIYEQFAPFANPADGDYPYGSIKNDSIPGAEDGTPLDAVWANDYAGFDAELFAQAGIVPNGQPDKLGASQRMDAINQLEKAASKITNAGGGSVQDFIDAQYTTIADVATGKFQAGTYVRLTDRSMGLFFVQSGGTANGSFLLNAGVGKTALLQITGCKLTASSLGLSSGTDYSVLFNNGLASFILTNNITDIELDTGDITVNNTLSDEYAAVTFSGKGKLLTVSYFNVLQRTGAEKTLVKQYHGHINSGTVYNQAFYNAVFKRKDVRVVYMADSIGVSADYDSTTIPAGYRNLTGVDNVDRNNALGAQIYNELVSILPKDVRIRFYSRCVGGLAYANLDQAWDSIGALWSEREQVTAGKTWRDCVLDLKPDLVIHGMGMNENPETYMNSLKSKWTDYLVTMQKTGTFDQAILTTPNPNYIDAAPFGDFKTFILNASKFYIAAQQRWQAQKLGASLIDVAFLSNLKRYGFDSRNCTYSAQTTVMTFPDGSTAKGISAGGDDPSLTNVSQNMFSKPIYHTITFTLNSDTPSNSAGFDFNYTAGDVNSTGNIIVQFNNGSINLYTGRYAQGGLFQSSVAYTLPASTDVQFTITVHPSGVYVYQGDTLLITNDDGVYSDTISYVGFRNTGSSGTVVVKNGTIRDCQFPRYSVDTLTNGEMYGELTYTNNPFGGGVNHPSSVGLSEIYVPPVREFINSMLNSKREETNIVGGTGANDAIFVGRIQNTQYNRVGISERGSTREIIIDIGAGNTYTVVKNTGGSLSVYLDPEDMSLFVKNTTESILQLVYSGEWAVKKIINIGNVTPRGSLLPDV